MMRRILLFLVIGLCIYTSGCATKVKVPVDSMESNHTTEKNYEIGRKKTANVGEALIKIKDYYYIQHPKFAKPSNDFTTFGGIVSVKEVKGKKYPVLGKTDLNGKEYYVVEIDGRGLLVSEKGEIASTVLSSAEAGESAIKVIYDFQTKPKKTRIKIENKKEIIKEKDYKNFEIVYSGIRGESIKLKYREFSPENLAKTAFFQELSYLVDKEIIQFKDITIKIHKATNQKIVYTVKKDDF